MTPQEREAKMRKVPFAGNPAGMLNPDLLGIKNFSGLAVESAFSGDSMSITITNTGTSAEDRLIALMPGWYTAAAQIKDKDGNAVAAIMADGNFITETDKVVNATGSNVNVNDVVNGSKTNPFRVKGIKVVGSAADQLDQKIEITELAISGKGTPRLIIPSTSKNADNADDKRADISLLGGTPVIFGPETQVIAKVKAGRSVQYTFFYDMVKSNSAVVEHIAKMK